MTKEEFRDIRPGMRLRIGPAFVEDPHDDLVDYLDTVQVLEKVDLYGTGWAYFEGLPQPFAISEVECVVLEMDCIDEEEYSVGDMSMIFGEV